MTISSNIPPHGWLGRTGLSLALVAVSLSSARGDDAAARAMAERGATAARGHLAPDLFSMNPDGTVGLSRAGSRTVTLDPDTIFGGGGSAPDPINPATLYGDDGALRNAARERGEALRTDTTSREGRAWGAVTATRTNRHAVTPIDGWLDTTRGIYGGGIDALQESWGACEEVTVTTGSTSTITWTEEELCTRHISPGFYSETTVLSHDVEAEVVTTAHTFTVPLHHTLGGWVNVVTGAGELDIRGRERCSIPDPGGDGPPTSGWCATRETVAISITPPGAGALCTEGGPEIVASMELDFYGDGRINRHLREAITQHPDCEDPVMRFTTGPAMWDHYRTRYLTRFGVGLGRNWFRLHTRAVEITKDEWAPPEVLANILGAEERGCTPTIIDISSYRDGNCYDAGGVAICPGTAQGDALSTAPFDPDELRTNRFGSEYRISYASCLPPVKPGESCAPLAEDPACLYVDSSIIEGALGEDQLAEDRYICERSTEVEDELASTSLKCPSGIRGVGDDLITIENEEPASLASVAAHLSAAQMLAADTDCGVDDEAGESLAECRIFKGQRRTCKRSIWGIVDCCRNPGAHVSLREYLQLMFRMAELAGKAGATYATNTADGLVNHPFTAGYPPEALIEMIYLNNVNTTLGEALTDPSPSVMADLLDASRQDMMNQTAMWTRGVFGHEMAGTMFLEAGGAISAIGTLSTISFAPQFKTDGSMAVNVMAAFGLYEVTALLASLIWECNDSEMHLHVQQELDSCHYVGSYCSDRNFFGGCNTRRRAYCCFSSPLARIMQQEIRSQTGMSWGSAQHTSCPGLTVAELEGADMTAIDLSEWQAILLNNGLLDDALNHTPDSLTGSGSSLAVISGDTDRQNVIERTEGYAADIDEQELHDRALDAFRGRE